VKAWPRIGPKQFNAVLKAQGFLDAVAWSDSRRGRYGMRILESDVVLKDGEIPDLRVRRRGQVLSFESRRKT